jgi:3-oxoacyl-[acyl-carrier-protein] synthase-3
MRAWISGTGSYLPEQVMTNAEVCQRAATTDEWIQQKLGIQTRRIAADDQQTSDLGRLAAERALEAAQIFPDQVDGIICALGTGDVHVPATAGYIQQKLGIKSQCFAMDIKMACAGGIGGIMMARGLVESGLANHILVVGTALLSRTAINWADPMTAGIFGDGAGAMLISRARDGDRGILHSRLYTDGSLTEIVGQYAGGTREPLTPEVVANGKHHLKMDGRAVWDCASREIPRVVREVLDAGGYTVDDVDFFVAHQANKKLLLRILESLGIPATKTHTNVETYGNTVSASALIAFDEAVRSGKIKPGQLVVLAAIGAGMSFGAHLIRW